MKMKKYLLLFTLLLSNYMFTQNWGEQILNQPNPAEGNSFGFSVDIDGDFAVIGAAGENFATGSAHIYKKDANGIWNHHQKIEAFVGKHNEEFFGYSVAIQGDLIFVSAIKDRINEELFEIPTGSVMIYEKDANGVWTGIQRLRASDYGHSDSFGSSIDIDGDFLVVGAKHQNYDANNQNKVIGAGAAYLFQKDVNGTWNEIQKITASHRDYSDNFGTSVSINGDYIVIGSENDMDVNNANEILGNGSAFVFKKDVNNVWSEVQKLKPTNGMRSFFGYGDVAIYGDYIAIGAKEVEHFENNTYYRGFVYIFKKDVNGIWNENQIIKATNTTKFGYSLSLDNNLLLISDPSAAVYDNGTRVTGVGASYLYNRNVNGDYNLAETIIASQIITGSNIGSGIQGYISYSAVAIQNNNFILGAPSTNKTVNNVLVYNIGTAYISGDLNNVLAEDIAWTGSVDTNWNNPLNWEPNTVPDVTNDVILNDVIRSPTILTGQNQIINSLTNFENLSIETGASLTISGNLDQRRAIAINSSEDASGSFILTGNQTNQNPTDSNYLRYVSGNNWHLISSPLTNVDTDVFAAASPLAAGQANNRGLGFYNNNIAAWEYYQAGAVGTGDFVMGRGSSINVTENTFLSFTGKIKSTDLINYAIDENVNGWNLVGNPFTAFINANSNANAVSNFLSENINSLDPLAATIYLWNPNTISYDPIGNGLEAKYIAPGQGFFVKSKIGGSTININKSMLTHQNGDLFLKEKPTSKIVLQIDNNSATSKTTIAFKHGMTSGLDISYDAAVFTGSKKPLSIYTQLLKSYENTSFAIQFLPELDENSTIIPVGISQEEETDITLSLKESNLDTSYKIYLEDKLLNTFTLISNTEKYTFFHEQKTNGLGRFFLHIQKSTLNIDSIKNSTIKVYKKNNYALQVNGINKGLLNIFDINGKNIIKNTVVNNLNQTIQLPKISKGIYIVNIRKSNGLNFIKKITF
jgi:hypothetical protein